MDVDQSIVELSEKLDAWCNGFFGLLESKDGVEQRNVLLRGVAIVKELDSLKAKGLAAISAVVARQNMIAEDDRSASLIQVFGFSARLADMLHDELLDTDGETKVWRLMDAVVIALDAVGSGRAALAAHLDHPDAGVCVAAGAYLIDLMPDRVIPILRYIEEKANWTSCNFRAHWLLLAWKLDGKSRFNNLSE